MMSNNKVLTVSYGAFSCTLEGFEDSFGTMKAIAEYFRDLAAEDRYFGAVPPQPDAETLARIAEREVSRRVDARAEEGRIVLTSTAPAVAEAVTPAPAIVEEATPEPETAVTETVAAEAIAEPVVEEAQVTVEEIIEETTDVDVADEAEPETEAEPDTEIDTDALARALADSLPAEATDTADAEPDDLTDDVAAEVEETIDAADEPDQEEEPEPIAVAEVVEEPPAPPAPTNMTDKLERIRAVVAQSRATAEEDDFNEDIEVDDLPDVSEDVEAPAPETAIEALLDERADQVAEATLSGDDTIEADKALLAWLDGDLDDADVAQADDDNLFEEDDAPEQPRARIIKVKRADMEAAMAAGDIDSPEDLARMIDDGALEEVDAEEVTAETTLSAEDEADLMRELAAVTHELEDEAPAPDMGADAEDDGDAPEVAEDIDDSAATHNKIAEDDVDRLLAETDEKMDEPEGSRSRDAFRQLRAAVVARNADEDLQRASEGEGDENAYRSDLAEVVRPRRPSAHGESTERPRAPAAAPLKLVAEQRVDVDQPATPAEPVSITPRRVSADAVPGDLDGGFADYASEMGAHALPELLEAAASYMSFVEGRDNFSRPQLMHKVRQLDPEDFRREDGLRSFGQLLREGKIEKLDGGRFAATGDIGFKPRRAAS